MEAGFIINEGVLEAYTLREKVIRVPNSVRIIGKGAFKGCVSVEEVILPQNVTDILDDAFKGCRKLKKLNFPPKLRHIGEYAFHRCHSLESIELPYEVKSLGSCSFLYCDSLECVSMPGVVNIGRQAFSNDASLKEIKVSSNLDMSCICDVFTGCSKISKISLSDETACNIESIIEIMSSNSKVHPIIKAIAEDIYRMLEINDGVLMKFLINVKDVDIPNGIKVIGKSCFFDKKGIISLKLPKTLTHIESKAFRNCINLERVEFTCNDVTISDDAFKNCTTLKYITLEDGSTYELKGLPRRNNEARPELINIIHSQVLNNFFISGTTLIKYRGNEERVVVPEGITIIGERAFAKNEVVGRIVLPDTIKEIHDEAFADCLLLQTINLQEGLEKICLSAFENCVKLISVTIPQSLTIIEKSVFNRCKNLNEIIFGKDIKEIKDQAFYGCSSLKNVIFPEKLESIGDMVFYKCLALKEIILPKSLLELGNNVFTLSGLKHAVVNCNLKKCGMDVFSQCNKLQKLSFSEEVKTIGDKFAFNCPSLKYVELPPSVEYIGRNAFEGSAYLNRVIENTKTEIVECAEVNDINENCKGQVSNIFLDGRELEGDIVIPDGITCIAGGAFYGNTKITSVRLPASLKKIGARAFCGCTSLENVKLPHDVTILEEGVFAYCTALEEVTLEGILSYISDNAFYGCSAVLKVPCRDVLFIGENAFSGCSKLENLQIKCNDIHRDAFRNTKFIDNMRSISSLIIVSNTVVEGMNCLGEVIIPEGITNISPYAFARNEGITSLELPESIVSIGDGAFSSCKNLKKLKLPISLKNIGKKAFEKCISLEKVTGFAECVEEGAFSYCISLKEALLHGIIRFGKEAFCGCTELRICECKELQYIGDGCFNECASLEKFNLLNIRSIGNGAFIDCNSLRSISLNSDTYVHAHAFENCDSVEEVILSHESLSFGSYAFAGCTSIKIIYINEMKYNTNHYKIIFENSIPDIVKAIYASAISCFSIDEKLTLYEYINKGSSVHIPEGIKTIEREVFKDAMNLEEIYIPRSVEYIGERAFCNTSWLEKKKELSSMVIVNNILVSYSSSNLQPCNDEAKIITKCSDVVPSEVLIPDYVSTVSGWAFANCYELTQVTFSSSRTVIEEYAFRNCINLKKVITSDGKEYTLTKISDRDNELLPSNVKQIFMDCLNCFKTDENNALVECTGNIDNLVLAEGITAIGDNVFKDSNLLTNIWLSNEATYIGKNAFEQCKWLVSVNNAVNVKKIEKFAFSACYLLENIELSSKLQYIGARAFENCSSLKTIIIPEGITEICEKTFYRCKSLEKVLLPSTLRTIGKEAFAFCYNLKEINLPKELEKIEERAFAWCSNLDIKNFPEGVLVEADAFSYKVI